MELQITQDQGTAIVAIAGQFTFADHAAFNAVFALATQEAVKDMIVDVGRLEFIDSAGLGMLLMLREACQLSKKPLILLNPAGHVQKVFMLAKFDEIFTLGDVTPMTQIALAHNNSFYPYNPVFSEEVQANSLSHYFFHVGNLPIIDGNYDNFYRHYIEADQYPRLADNLDYIQHEQPDISLCLSTQTAFSQPTSELFMQMLQKQFWLSDGLYESMKTCLQESILNAIIHGNLNIHHNTQVLSDFEQYYASISRALELPEQANKRLSIFAWRKSDRFILAVCDQGKGFALAERKKMPPHTLPHGRGLMLIENFASRVWQATPNHLFMEFEYDLHSV